MKWEKEQYRRTDCDKKTDCKRGRHTDRKTEKGKGDRQVLADRPARLQADLTVTLTVPLRNLRTIKHSHMINKLHL